MSSPLKLSDIQRHITALEPATAWTKYLAVVATSQPFWEQAIANMARLTELEHNKAEAYHVAAEGAFKLMDDWYFERIPYVKARRNEIDSAISFIRNGALRQEVASAPAAASARNLAGVLRILLYLATRGYRPEQYPQLMTNGLFGFSAVKSLFPVDLSDLVSQFARTGESPVDSIDHLATIVNRGAEQYHLKDAFARLNQELQGLWADFDTPKTWAIPGAAWQPQKTSLLTDVHYQAVQDFHARG